MRVDLLPRRTLFPDRCCACGLPGADRRYRFDKGPGRNPLTWSFPICAPCLTWLEAFTVAEAWARRARTVKALGLVLALTILGVVSLAVLPSGTASVLLTLLAIPIRGVVSRSQHTRRECRALQPGPWACEFPVRYVKAKGDVHQFEFRNLAFAVAFPSAEARDHSIVLQSITKR